MLQPFVGLQILQMIYNSDAHKMYITAHFYHNVWAFDLPMHYDRNTYNIIVNAHKMYMELYTTHTYNIHTYNTHTYVVLNISTRGAPI